MIRSTFSLAALLLLLAGWQPAPPTRYVIESPSSLWVTGTSSLHDWRCDAGQLVGWIEGSGEGSLSAITASQIRVPVSGLECKNGTMNGKMRDALRADAHGTISFTLTAAELASGNRVRATGRLTIAGETRSVTTTVQAQITANGKLRVAGELPVTMSGYGVKPPTAMMGALKTGDDVVVHFELLAAPAGTL